MPPRPSPSQPQKILPVTGVGSYPPPGWLRQALEAHLEHRIDDEAFAEAGQDAVQVVIGDQERAGLDLVTDGEIGRILGAPEPLLALRETLGFLWGLLARMEGVVYEQGREARGRFRLMGRLAAPKGLGLAAEFQAARRVASRPLKATLPGPFSLALSLAERPEEVEKVLEVLGPILRRELEALAAAGAGDVQLDEPSLTTLSGISLQRWVDYLNELVAGLSFRLHLHVCFRNVTGSAGPVPRSYRPLIPYLNDVRAAVIHLEYSLNDMRELALLDQIAYDKHLAIGVIDAHQAQVESPQTVAERIRSCLRHVSVQRLSVAPDCGLSALPRAVARAKLESLAAGAALVRGELNRGKR